MRSTRLNPREEQVVLLVCAARMNKEISAALGTTEGTIKSYMRRIMAKIGARDRVDVAMWAVRSGLYNPKGAT